MEFPNEAIVIKLPIEPPGRKVVIEPTTTAGIAD
jgi:hypothetical protein